MAPKRKHLQTPSGAYDKNFEQKMNQHNMWITPLHKTHVKPNNHDHIKRIMEAELPPDLVTELRLQYLDFIERNDKGSQEALFGFAIPTIQGEVDGPYERNRLFNNMCLGHSFKDAKPDHFEGVDPRHISSEVAVSLSKMIIPTNTRPTKDPAAPNYFLEVKVVNQDANVARLQAAHDGILGARAMYSLQNYRRQPPITDGNAYTFSVTYQPFMLTIYAIHITASRDGTRLRYNVTEIDSHSMKKEEDFIKGVTACRNIRALAKKFRRRFVKEANKRAPSSASQSFSTSGGISDLSETDPEESTDSEVDAEASGSGHRKGSKSYKNNRGPESAKLQETVGMSPIEESVAEDTDSAEEEEDAGSSEDESDEEQEPADASINMSFLSAPIPPFATGGYHLRSRKRREEVPDDSPRERQRRKKIVWKG
ncbi:hypothetical protein VP1G_07416 [Cytospora mali]|uniref:DUF7924 domain-containing protein n=1 Tax=Cytospora mali TaxID=578113 RepID=A0A194V8J8_CYTMA|nr:hypothetical protein VP1G_07416 [Valsa mali var. pyri (nom. inval.)]